MIFTQPMLDLYVEKTVVLFAGGGGADVGIRSVIGHDPDDAVNHDPAAIAMHKANHPQTNHHVCDVFEVDPRAVADGKPIGLLWASPDCTYHSKARGAKPIRHKNRKRRALAWVVKRWTGTVRPRVVMLENVEEFLNWGPLVGPPEALRPCSRRRGRTFRQWIRQTFLNFGYAVEWRELRACDYGAPTIRKRLFLIARCDGQPIVWPEPTHGAPDSIEVRAGRRLPYRTAAGCIDWSIPMLSIFATKAEAQAWGKVHGQAAPVRPLAEATQRRIARGVMRYVVNNPKPFLVTLNHGGGKEHAPRSLDDQMRTVAASRDAHALVAPVVAGVGGRAGQSPERPGDVPFQTVTAKGDAAIVAPILADVAHGEVGQNGSKRWSTGARSVELPANAVLGSGNPALVAPLLTEHANAAGQRTFAADEPLRTQCANVKGGHFSVVAPCLVPRYGEREGQEPRCRSVEEPAPVIVPTGNGASLVAAHLATYHGEKRDGDHRGAGAAEPLDTIDTANRHALVASFIAQHNAGYYTGDGRDLNDPAGTVCASGSPQGLVAANLVKLRGTSTAADAGEPLHTASAKGTHHGIVATHLVTNTSGHAGAPMDGQVPTLTTGEQQAAVAAHLSYMQGGDPDGGEGEPAHPLRAITGTTKASAVYAFLEKYYGTDQDPQMGEPLHTVTTKDRFGVVTVTVDGQPFVIADIAMRMLQPRELYRAQGFPDSYIIDRGADGRRLTKTEQVRMCGNSVSPPVAAALTRANLPEYVVPGEAPAPVRSRRPRSRKAVAA